MFDKWINDYAESAIRYLLAGNIPLALNELRNMTCHSVQTEDLRLQMDALKSQLEALSGRSEVLIAEAVDPLRYAAISAGPNNGARVMLHMLRKDERRTSADVRFRFSS